jgi:hypothetical protein
MSAASSASRTRRRISPATRAASGADRIFTGDSALEVEGVARAYSVGAMSAAEGLFRVQLAADSRRNLTESGGFSCDDPCVTNPPTAMTELTIVPLTPDRLDDIRPNLCLMLRWVALYKDQLSAEQIPCHTPPRAGVRRGFSHWRGLGLVSFRPIRN